MYRSSSHYCPYVKEASKLTTGQPVEVHTLHPVQSVLEIKEDKWLTAGRILHQALLLDTPEITIKIYQIINPATLISTSLTPNPVLEHHILEIINEIYSWRPDLHDNPDKI